MNEFVLVEFLARYPDDFYQVLIKLEKLGSDFEIVTHGLDMDEDEDGEHSEWGRVSGRINSQAASIIKMQDSFLAERMRISYISDELKDRYRK